MHIDPFGVEQWMNAYENNCSHNLAETCVASLTISELCELVGVDDPMAGVMDRQITYGDIVGSDALRSAIAALFTNQEVQNVLLAHGTIGANALVYQTLIQAGDKVVSVVPTYQQHVSYPEALGVQVHQINLAADADYVLDVGALALVAKGAKLITIVNPNNPTGAVLDSDQIRQVVEIAKENDAWILADEVYRGTEQSGIGTSFADHYDKAISTGSTSKAFALAGLRVGWIVGPPDVLTQIEHHRDYTTISIGILNDHFATFALKGADKMLARSHAIVTRNHAIVSDWIKGQNTLALIAPKGGTTALLHYLHDTPSYDLAVKLLKDTGVLMTPGSLLSAEGTLRLGYANHTPVLQEGLKRVGAFFDSL